MTSVSSPESSATEIYDICIVGGGINGTGIARDAAGRGLSVLLAEQGDLAQATSSASTKIIHGGLRYLEYYDFRLVHESLHERDRLLGLAPHLIRPLTFILPHNHSIRPYWMVRLGLYLYDCLGAGKKLPSSRSVKLSHHAAGEPLQPHLERGFSYSDCWGDDARLVAMNAVGAVEKGARIETRTRCMHAQPDRAGWLVTLVSEGKTRQVHCKVLVNAAGPWVRTFLDSNELSDFETPSVRLVQGSHIIVPRLYDGDQAYMLQQTDGRIVFAIPYEGKYTQIGTTETLYRGDPLRAEITAQEMDYLLTAANQSFKKQVSLSDIVRSFSGIRPLFDDSRRDAKAVTRDYRLYTSRHDESPLLSVFGGKITTYRKLAEHAGDHLVTLLGHGSGPWTGTAPLPGGDIKDMSVLISRQQQAWPDIDLSIIVRYAHAYGTRMDKILSADMGTYFGDGIYEAEISYLLREEFARSMDDVLWRRSKLGLHISEKTRSAIEKAFSSLLQKAGVA